MQRIKSNPLPGNLIQKKFYKKPRFAATWVRKPLGLAGCVTGLAVFVVCAAVLLAVPSAYAQTGTAYPAASTINKDLIHDLRNKRWMELSEAERTRLLQSRYTDWNMMSTSERNASVEDFRRQWEAATPANRSEMFNVSPVTATPNRATDRTNSTNPSGRGPVGAPNTTGGPSNTATTPNDGVGSGMTPGSGAGSGITPGSGGVGGSATPSGRH